MKIADKLLFTAIVLTFELALVIALLGNILGELRG